MQLKISKLTITNFRSIKEETFLLNNFTPLIGYNNAGKSNILKALLWLFKKSTLEDVDFNDISRSIIVEASIEGINDDITSKLDAKHKKAIESYIKDEKLIIRRSQTKPNDKESPKALSVLDQEKNEWKPNPNGIDNAISALFPEPIYIKAMDNAEDDISKNGASSTIGKLLALITSELENHYSSEIEESLSSLNKLLGVDGTGRAEELKALDTSLNEKVTDFFQGIKVKVHFPTPEIKEILKKGTIKIFEDGFDGGKDVSNMGNGAQRSIQMALIRHLADIKATDDAETNTLLLIDEPELYLHPQAIEILKSALKKLSGHGFQIVFSTHSPFMVDQKDILNTNLIRKDVDKGTYKRVSLHDAISDVEKIPENQLQILFDITNSSNILFADKVLIVEGRTEKMILPSTVKAMTEKTFLEHKLALVPVHGCENIKNCLEILKIMGVPSKAIVDLDYAFKNGIKLGYLPIGDANIQKCKDIFEALKSVNEHIYLDDAHLPCKGDKKDTDKILPEAAYHLMSQKTEAIIPIEKICETMKSHNIWVWKFGSIEKHFPLEGKDIKHWTKFLKDIDSKNTEELFGDHFKYVSECLTWCVGE